MNNRINTFKRIVIVIVILVLMAGLIQAVTWSLRVVSKIIQLEALIDWVRNLQSQGLQMDNISKVIYLTEHISSTVDELVQEIKPILPVIRKMKNMAGVGPYFQMIEPGLDYASNLSKAFVVLGKTLVPLLQEDTLDSTNSPLETFSNFFSENQYNFENAENLLQKAMDARAQINPYLIPEKYRDTYLSIDGSLSNVPLIFQALRVAPHLVGTDKPITYLILVQNRDELRASGGFITAFGLLQLKEGRILDLKINDSTQYDYVKEVRKPPFPLKEIMFANYLVARDANWSPDFPTTAKETQEMYYLSTENKSDGVIAFNQELIVNLLEITGPITLPDEEIPIDASNVEAKMIEFKQAAIREGNSAERKEFLSIMAPPLIEKIFKIRQPVDQINLVKLFIGAIQRGDLLLFFNDPKAQDVLYQTGLDGSVRPGDGDFLMLVDSNVGFGKIDQYIERSLTYLVNLEDISNPLAEIQLRYEHTHSGSEQCLQGVSNNSMYDFPRCYWDYWRLLTVKDAKLMDAQFEPVPKEYFLEQVDWSNEIISNPGEAGTNMLAGLVVVPPLNIKEITLRTQLPTTVIQEGDENHLIYSLRIQKQPGVRSLPVKIQITVPQGYSNSELPDGWTSNQNKNVLIWNDNLRIAEYFILIFERNS